MTKPAKPPKKVYVIVDASGSVRETRLSEAIADYEARLLTNAIPNHAPFTFHTYVLQPTTNSRKRGGGKK